LSFQDSLKLLPILADQGTREIDVMGGEPLLLPWMPDFAKTASRQGMQVNISTNGSCPGSIIQFKDGDRQKITIGVSLEGSSEKRHNLITKSSHFSLAMGTIETLLSLDLNFVVKTVVSRTTVPDIRNIIDLLRSLDIRRYYLIHMDILTGNRAIMKEALSYPDFKSFCDHMQDANRDMEIFTVSASCFTKELIGHRARCSGGVNKLSVLSDGSVFPCNLFHGFSEFYLGNVLQDEFASIWENSRLDAFREPPGDICDNMCINKGSCTGGCPAHGHYHSGYLHSRDVRCELPHVNA
jgi:radical SAM protein with 4Fe4S-binding SPASM domain